MFIRPKTSPDKIIRSVALPSEHGGWAFLLNPCLLGMLVAPSWPGAWLTLAALGVFLAHQPLKIAVKDRLKGTRPPRTVWAERFVLGYGVWASVAFALLLLYADRAFLTPLVLGLPFALVQLYYDSRNQSRALLAECAGALALATLAPAIAILGGWPFDRAWPLWFIMAALAVPAILYVRARLKLEYGKPIAPTVVWVAHGVAFLGSIALALGQLIPWTVVVGMAVLWGRAVYGLSRFRSPSRPAIIGIQEIAFGLMIICLAAVGY